MHTQFHILSLEEINILKPQDQDFVASEGLPQSDEWLGTTPLNHATNNLCNET